MVNVSTELFTADAIAAHTELARTTYSEAAVLDRAHFRWKHLEGPCGASIAVNMHDGQMLVGRSLIQLRDFQIDPSKVVRAGVIFDLMLAPGYRSAQQFLALVRAQWSTDRVDLVLHTSNATSDPLYRMLLRYPISFRMAAFGLPVRIKRILRKLLGWTVPGIDMLTAPWRWALRAAASLGRAATGIRFELGMPAEADLQSVVQRFRQVAGPHLRRDRAFLEWRFQNATLFKATIATVVRTDRVCGYVVWRKIELEGIEFLVLMDFVLDDDLTSLQRLVVRLELARRACEEGADILFVMANTKNKLAAQVCNLPLIRIPERYLPHPTPIFVHPKRDELAWLRQQEDMFLTLGDLDYF
jgi:hypothetical protein